MAFAHRVSYELRCYSQVSSKIIHVPLRSWATFKSQHLTLSHKEKRGPCYNANVATRASFLEYIRNYKIGEAWERETVRIAEIRG